MSNISDGIPYYGMDEDLPDEPDTYYWEISVKQKKFNTDIAAALSLKLKETEDEEVQYERDKKVTGLTQETVDKWQQQQEAQIREQQRVQNYNNYNYVCYYYFVLGSYPSPNYTLYNACLARNPYR